ncbi:MAG: hypothetical protein H7833_02185 [Magnetococcus sp. DMHC-1]|nr:hypothetical protein [Magnetococcales bacterium]
MKFGLAPGLTEEDMIDIERHHQMADRIVANRKINPPTEYFKGEEMLGGKFYPPGEKVPPSVWEQMKASGEIGY